MDIKEVESHFKPNVSRENKKALRKIVLEQNTVKILSLEKEYVSKKNLAKIFDYNYTALCRMMRKENSLLFNRKIESIKCSRPGCEGTKTIKFKYFGELSQYKNGKKPFCSRECYYSFLRIDRGAKIVKLYIFYKLNSYNNVDYPSNLPFSRKKSYHKNDVALVSMYHHKPEDMSKNEFISRLSDQMEVSETWLRKCINKGLKAEKTRSQGPYQARTSVDQLRMMNLGRKRKGPISSFNDDVSYTSIFEFIDEVEKHDPRINRIFNHFKEQESQEIINRKKDFGYLNSRIKEAQEEKESRLEDKKNKKLSYAFTSMKNKIESCSVDDLLAIARD